MLLGSERSVTADSRCGLEAYKLVVTGLPQQVWVLWGACKNLAFVAISSKDQHAEQEKSFFASVGQLEVLAVVTAKQRSQTSNPTDGITAPHKQ